MTKIKKLAEIIKKTNNLVFFGGAGVSVASNIPDFRSSSGIFNELNTKSPEEILSRSFFDQNPEEFFSFYKTKMVYPEAKPNPAHLALARLEEMGKLKAIITQNIDCLHQDAGNTNVIELHGTIRVNHCMKCNKEYDLDFVLNSKLIPYCSCGGIVKPDVVLYEESLDGDKINQALAYISKAETMIVAGTSLLVNPAAGMVRLFAGDNFVIINKSSTAYDKYADLCIKEDVAWVLSEALALI